MIEDQYSLDVITQCLNRLPSFSGVVTDQVLVAKVSLAEGGL